MGSAVRPESPRQPAWTAGLGGRRLGTERVTTYQTGIHDPTGYTLYMRPNLIANPNDGPKTVQQWFNTAAFAAPPSALSVFNNHLNPVLAVGNAGRAPIVGPGIQNWDVGVYKNFAVRERIFLQYRAELFDAFNHPNFGEPNTTYGTSTFGQITSASPGRQIQMSLKLKF